MKITDVPQTGKLGLTVTWPGRNGLIRRTRVTPRNPRSGAQQVIRQNLATQAAAYDQLSDAQQEAWIAAEAQIQSTPSLGQRGQRAADSAFRAVLALPADPALPTDQATSAIRAVPALHGPDLPGDRSAGHAPSLI